MGNRSGPDDSLRAATSSPRAAWRAESATPAAAPLILLVDDDADCRAICRTILEHVGFRVVETADGLTALQLMRHSPPDLLILDLSLPIMSGWEVAREMRADPRLRRIPIVVLTAHALEATRRMSLEVGCDRYLVKPLSPLQLLREVEWFLALPRPAVGGRLTEPLPRPATPGRS